MKQISILTAFLIWLVCLGDGANILIAQAGQRLIELSSRSSTPGATLVLNGKGFGSFKSTQFNRVTVNGVSALVQRWEADVIEVKVPFKATSGFVEVLIGKKKLFAGFLAIVVPRIEAITPTEGERGTTLHITGHHFGLSAGARDPNTMFGVNDVVVGGVGVRPKRWKDDKIELEIPPNAVSGDVVVRLASSDPLPDGSCRAPVEHVVSNAVSLKLIPSVRVDPISGPVGTKVVLFGQGFGDAKELMDDAVLIGGRPVAIAQWKDDVASSFMSRSMRSRVRCAETSRAGTSACAVYGPCSPRHFHESRRRAHRDVVCVSNGEHFGFYSESGSTPYNFTDFDPGGNRVEIGGVPAVIYRWNDDRIDVWVPFSVKTGKVVIYRSANRPNIGGLCCAERGTQATEAGDFTLVTPVIESYEPRTAGLDATVTIKGRGFGTFLKTAEHADLGLNREILQAAIRRGNHRTR